MSSSALPIVLGLAAAALFGISSVTSKRGLASVEAHAGSLIVMSTVVVMYLLLAPWWMRAGEWFSPGFWVFVLNGLIHPMLSMYLALEATSRTGPTVAATFAATAPLFAAITAVLFLGESLSWIVALGTIGIMVGIMALSWSPHGISGLMRAALLFATGAGVIRGLNHTVGKWGIELLPNVFMAGFVSFVVSLTGSLILYRLRRGALPSNIPRRGMRYFILSGVIIGCAIACMYGSLSLGDVVVVSPLINAYPVFTLIAACLLGHERLSRKLVMGVAFVVSGVTLISIGSV